MIKEKDQVSPLMAFFLISAAQIGVGVLSFQSVINKYAGHDAWISVIVTGLSIHIVIWLMYKILNQDKGDFTSIHRRTFGKWIGAILSIPFSLYLFLLAAVVLRSYIEIIQVWMFPHIKVWALLLFIMPLIYYIVSGAFRVVVGVCFLGVVYPMALIPTLFFPLQYSHISNIMPILDHSLLEIVQSSMLVMFSFLGIGCLFVYYPFIKKSETSQKWAHFGNLYTTLLYTVICFISYIYYNQNEIKDIIWPTLGMWKIIELPLVARFEYIGIATLFFSILPNLALYVWVGSRMINRTFHFTQKKVAVSMLLIIYVICLLVEGRDNIAQVSEFVSKIGVGLLFYIPILFLFYFLIRKVKSNVS